MTSFVFCHIIVRLKTVSVEEHQWLLLVHCLFSSTHLFVHACRGKYETDANTKLLKQQNDRDAFEDARCFAVLQGSRLAFLLVALVLATFSVGRTSI